MWIKKTVEIELDLDETEVIDEICDDTIVEAATRIIKYGSYYHVCEILEALKGARPDTLVNEAIALLQEDPTLGRHICGTGLAHFCKAWMEIVDSEETQDFLKKLGIDIQV